MTLGAVWLAPLLAARIAAAPPAAVSPPAVAPAVAAPIVPPVPASAAAVDRWTGGDKVKHAALAGFVQSTGTAAGVLAGLDRRDALLAAGVVTAAVSLGKELVDRRAGGRFSWRDLAADAAGALAWSALLARSAR